MRRRGEKEGREEKGGEEKGREGKRGMEERGMEGKKGRYGLIANVATGILFLAYYYDKSI